MKPKINWKRVILISVIAVAVAWVFVFVIPDPEGWVPNPKGWGLGFRLMGLGSKVTDLGSKVLKWEFPILLEGGAGDLLINWDAYQKSAGKDLVVWGIEFDRPCEDWPVYRFIPEKGVWQDDDETVTPDSPMYQRLEEIRRKLMPPEAEDD